MSKRRRKNELTPKNLEGKPFKAYLVIRRRHDDPWPEREITYEGIYRTAEQAEDYIDEEDGYLSYEATVTITKCLDKCECPACEEDEDE